VVGDIAANIDNIIEAAVYARDQLNADMIVFPELTITGYPAEDLLFRADFITAANNAIYQLADRVAGIALVVGFPERDGNKLYNSAVVLHQALYWPVTASRHSLIMGCLMSNGISLPGISPVVFEFNGTSLA